MFKDSRREFSFEGPQSLYYNYNTGDSVFVNIKNARGLLFKFGQYSAYPIVSKKLNNDTMFSFFIPERKTYFIEIDSVKQKYVILIDRKYVKEMGNINVELKDTTILNIQSVPKDTFEYMKLEDKRFDIHPKKRAHVPFLLPDSTVEWSYGILTVDDTDNNKQKTIQDFNQDVWDYVVSKIDRFVVPLNSKMRVNFFFSDVVSVFNFVNGEKIHNKKWKHINEGRLVSSEIKSYSIDKTPEKKAGVAFENPTEYTITVQLYIVAKIKKTKSTKETVKKPQKIPSNPL